MFFLKGISPKVNIITRLEFKLTLAAVQHIGENNMEALKFPIGPINK